MQCLHFELHDYLEDNTETAELKLIRTFLSSLVNMESFADSLKACNMYIYIKPQILPANFEFEELDENNDFVIKFPYIYDFFVHLSSVMA